MNGNPPPPKKEVSLALLERGSVHVHLDPRANGVVVPAWFKRQPQLVLQVGLNMPVPIPDLRVDEDGMSCTLSFNRAPFFCIVPWTSVYAMVGDDGRGMVWPEDVPAEVALQGRARETEQAGKKPSPERQLAVVKTAPEPAKKASKPRGPRAAKTATPGVEKKPRAKKARPAVTEAPSPKPARSKSDGVLLQIPPAQKPRRVPTEPPATRPGEVPSLQRIPEPRAEPSLAASAARPEAPASPKASPTSQRPGKAGKTRREIPPYLRVVK